MAPILWRLQSCGIDFPSPNDEKSKVWSFPKKIAEKDIDFFRYLVENHQLLQIEYSIHCTLLAHDLLHKDRAKLTAQIETALKIAELLEHIYRDYLNVPQEAERMRRDQLVYRELLAHQGYQFIDFEDEYVVDSSYTRVVRNTTGTANVPRNFIARLRRLLVATVVFASEFGEYRSAVNFIDQFITPILTFAAWIFFVPRSIINLFLLGKHLIPGPWMSEEEEALGWQTRFIGQLQRRWFELANDVPWMILGLLNCFLLVGPLAPIGFYASAVLLAYDVLVASFRTHIEVGRLKTVEVEYQTMLKEDDLSQSAREDINSYLFYLRQRIAYERKRLYIQVVNTSVLFVAFALAFPIFAFNPIIPLIGGALAVLMTIACYLASNWVDKQRPVDRITLPPDLQKSVGTNGFFKPNPSSSPTYTEALDEEEACSMSI